MRETCVRHAQCSMERGFSGDIMDGMPGGAARGGSGVGVASGVASDPWRWALGTGHWALRNGA